MLNKRVIQFSTNLLIARYDRLLSIVLIIFDRKIYFYRIYRSTGRKTAC